MGGFGVEGCNLGASVRFPMWLILLVKKAIINDNELIYTQGYTASY